MFCLYTQVILVFNTIVNNYYQIKNCWPLLFYEYFLNFSFHFNYSEMTQAKASAGELQKILSPNHKVPLQVVPLLQESPGFLVWCLSCSKKGKCWGELGQFFYGIDVKPTLNWSCVTFTSDMGACKNTYFDVQFTTISKQYQNIWVGKQVKLKWKKQ